MIESATIGVMIPRALSCGRTPNEASPRIRLARPAISAAIVAVALAAVITGVAFGATPSTILYQGFLTDAEGFPVTGPRDLAFAIWDSDSAGTSLWTESHAGVTVGDGLFAVVLGSTNPLSAALFGQSNRWLETSVGGAPLAPRRPMTSFPYAFRSAVADSVAGGSSGEWSRNGTSIYYQGGNVGVGTNSPNAPLAVPPGAVVGSVVIGRDQERDIPFEYESVSIQNSSYSLRLQSPNDILFHTGPSAAIPLVVKANGRIGVGTTDPASTLHVVGDVRATLSFLQAAELSSTVPYIDFHHNNSPLDFTARLIADGPAGTLSVRSYPGSPAVFNVEGRVQTDVLEIRGGADIAERFRVPEFEAQQVHPGLVVSIDPEREGGVRLSRLPYDTRVAGVISGANGLPPGMTLRHEASEVGDGFPVALTGRVYAWCDADLGKIEPGVLLTTSATPGHAMAARDLGRAQGATLGKAMGSLESGRGLVLVLVNLH